MAQVSVMAKLQSVAGKRDELVEAFQVAIHTASHEAGTRYYMLHSDNQDEDTLWVYELYESQEALDRHRHSDDFAALGALLGPLLGGRPQLTYMTPIAGKGL